jgi:hypothetical protein
VKFSCERCGKRYATAEDPAPGRVYKLKCKACGNLIVVRPGSSKAAAPVSAPPRATSARAAGGLPSGDEPVVGGTPAAIPVPDLQAEVAPPALLAPAGLATESTPVPRRDPDPTSLIPMAGVVSAPEEEFKPPPGDTGYVDLFADEVGGDGQIASEAPSPAPDDPFLAIARASLPDGFPLGGEAARDPFLAAAASASPDPDPFAGVEPVPEHPPVPERPAAGPDPARVRPPAPAPSPVAAPKPPPKRSILPAALLGMGVGLLAVIALVVFMGGGSKAPTRQASPPPASSRPAPALADPSEPTPSAEPRESAAAAEPAPRKEDNAGPKPEPRRHRDEPKPRRKEPQLAQEPKAERAPPPPPPEPPVVAKPQERQVSLPDVEGALTPDVVNKVLAANRKAFAACIVQAGKSPEVSLDGRTVQLRLTINPNGFVTYPTLDDVPLNSTEMGACLKAAARVMVFPKFKGEPFHAEVPLLLK